MSTNYYVHTPDGQEIHLGKFANGWPFMFRGHPDRGVVDYDSWRAQFSLGEIQTESGAPVTLAEMEETVESARKWWRSAGYRPRSDQHDDGRGNRFTDTEFC